MQTLAQLGQEYLDTAELLRIRMKKLQMDKGLLNQEDLRGGNIEQRIDFLYREILQMTDIGNKLLLHK